jgi:hypothetical protein
VVLPNRVRGPVRKICIGALAGVIAIMMAESGHGEREIIFIAAFGNEVEIIGIHGDLGAPIVSGIGMENVPILVFVEDAESRHFFN